MRSNRKDLFNLDQNELAQLARIFSNPARIAILQYLADAGSCVVNDLVSHLALSQPTVSQHLRDLKMTGIIQGTVEENTVAYSIDSGRWLEVKEIFDDFFVSIKMHTDSAQD